MDSNKIYRFEELESMFPKSIGELKLFINDFLLAQSVPVEMVDEETSNICKHTINSANPILFQIFDQNKIYIVIDCMDYIDGKEWVPMVINTDLEVKPTRTEAMVLAFNEAFLILEKQLEKNEVPVS